jgi:hypothetical protein
VISPYRKKTPVNGTFVDATGKSARGPKSSSSTCPGGHKSAIDCTAMIRRAVQTSCLIAVATLLPDKQTERGTRAE